MWKYCWISKFIGITMMWICDVWLINIYCCVIDLSCEHTCVTYLCCDLDFFCFTSCKNIWNSCVIVIWVHDLLITMNIIVVAHVDAKDINRSGFCTIRSGSYRVERSSAWLTFPLPGCGNLVPAPSHTTSGETLTCASRSLSKGSVV